MTNTLFLGAGNMGGAILRGMLAAGVSASEIAVADISESIRLSFAADVAATYDPSDVTALGTAVNWADRVIVAIKPGLVHRVLSSVGPECTGKLLISVAAGVPCATIVAAAPGARIVRVMPNTGALVGHGAAGVFGGPGATSADIAGSIAMFELLGVAVEVPTEDLLHTVTAVSGSGPAWFFLLAEHIASVGEAMGLPRDAAVKLAAATADGAGKLMATGEDPAVLRGRVACPGGTTAAGVDAMTVQLLEAVKVGMTACDVRSREIAAQNTVPAQ
jgi:pyrroline-5-carboxylate reductase